MGKARVVIVDDQYISRQLFAMYLHDAPGYEVTAVIESAAYVVEYLKSHPADIVLMDILMNDDSNGLDASAQIKQLWPKQKIIALTSMAEATWIDRARSIGIDSFWYKDTPQEAFLEVLDRTMAGESVYPDSPPQIKLGLADSTEFSARELDVLRWLVKGLTSSEIAERLHISEETVKSHIKRMLEKTGYKNRTMLSINARVQGIVVNLEDEF